jgi:hypothetical protein
MGTKETQDVIDQANQELGDDETSSKEETSNLQEKVTALEKQVQESKKISDSLLADRRAADDVKAKESAKDPIIAKANELNEAIKSSGVKISPAQEKAMKALIDKTLVESSGFTSKEQAEKIKELDARIAKIQELSLDGESDKVIKRLQERPGLNSERVDEGITFQEFMINFINPIRDKAPGELTNEERSTLNMVKNNPNSLESLYTTFVFQEKEDKQTSDSFKKIRDARKSKELNRTKKFHSASPNPKAGAVHHEIEEGDSRPKSLNERILDEVLGETDFLR